MAEKKHGCNIIGGDTGGCCGPHDNAYQQGLFWLKIAADFALFWCMLTKGSIFYKIVSPIVLAGCLSIGTIWWLRYLARRWWGWFPKKA